VKLDALTSASLDRIKTALEGKPSGSYCEVAASDVANICAIIPAEKASKTTLALAHGVRESERDPKAPMVHQLTECLRHLIEQVGDALQPDH